MQDLYSGFLPICQNQIPRTFQGPYEGYISGTKLNHTSTFISIYKCHKLSRDFMRIWGQKEAIWNTFLSINWFGNGVLENQIQAL